MMNGRGLSASFAAMVAVGLAAHANPARAADAHGGIPFEVAEVFFELNDTDGDLGIHALIDGEPWKRLEIEAPGERRMLHVRVQGRLRRQGLTELFFESAEPTFDELPPEEFFDRFPEGTYEISGATLEGEELESTAELTHVLPAPPVAFINDEAAAQGCDTDVPSVGAPIEIRWEPVTLSHPALGRTGETIDVVRYQVVVTREEPEPLELSVDLPPDVLAFAVPSDLVESGDELKFEILVREASGNQTAVESCFAVE